MKLPITYLGWGVYVTNRVEGDAKKRKVAWSAAAHIGGKDISLWTSAYPSVSATEILTLTTMSGKQLVMTALLWKIFGIKP